MPSILITGGAGFIGVNSASRFAAAGWRVAVLDNLSRRGATDNLEWLRARADVALHQVDVRDAETVARTVRSERPDVVLHLAGQVAVTTSVANPREDFDVNALGTFNVLEAVRLEQPRAFFINASTNKVYGKMEDLGIELRDGRYVYATLPAGVDEERGLDFHSPYGCSKGVADQYTIDYARIYGLRTVTFRQSCIYGPRQFGIEDQGWVAWFTIAAVTRLPVSIYGDGRQVRDVLHVDDLVRAYMAAIDRADSISGQAFNVGGGPGNTLSLLELLDHLERSTGAPLRRSMHPWRPGDQPVFVCDIRKAGSLLGWSPQVDARDGIRSLFDWVAANRRYFAWMAEPRTETSQTAESR